MPNYGFIFGNTKQSEKIQFLHLNHNERDIPG